MRHGSEVTSASVRFGDLTFAEIAASAAAGAVAVIPTGCTEQQGPHLPVDFDTWMVTAVAEAAAGQARNRHAADVLVLPTLPFGPTPEHRSFGSGYVDVPQRLHEEILTAVLVSLAEQGFHRVAVWRGCGGHDLSSAVEAFNARQRRPVAVQPELPYREIWLELGDPRDDGGHADGFATSIALHLRPDAVRADLIADPDSRPVDWDDPDLDFRRYTRTGVLGRPTVASAELGERLWGEIVTRVGAMFAAMARHD